MSRIILSQTWPIWPGQVLASSNVLTMYSTHQLWTNLDRTTRRLSSRQDERRQNALCYPKIYLHICTTIPLPVSDLKYKADVYLNVVSFLLQTCECLERTSHVFLLSLVLVKRHVNFCITPV